MWIDFSKVVLCFYFCSAVAYAYKSKLDYIKSYSQKNSVSGPYKVSTSRYPNLEKVKSRIENMNGDAGATGSKDSLYRIRHKGWSYYKPKSTTTTTTATTTTENELFESYGDLEDDDDFDDYEESLEDEDDELDYEDDSDDQFFDDLSDVQAEEPTERPTAVPKLVSSLTEYKWRHFGSASEVAESRRNHLQMNNTPERRRVNAVVEHSMRVNSQGRCRNPSPKVIPVQKEYPDASKTYTPHCTILHRCGEDTGCCKYDTTCQYKSRVLVQLHFYTTTLGSTDTKVEKLSFYNHTECECRDKSNETSMGMTESAAPALTFKSGNTQKPPIDLKKCQCTKHFKLMPTFRYKSCNCDCEEENLDCIQLKKGNEHLSMNDRMCIADNECTVPICEYGRYSKNEGKCPSIADKIMEYRSIKITY